MTSSSRNTLFYGDNLDILRDYVDSESVEQTTEVAILNAVP